MPFLGLNLQSQIFLGSLVGTFFSLNIFLSIFRGGIPDTNDLLSKNDIVKLKRCVFAEGKIYN